MSNQADNKMTAALTFNVPQKVGWSVQSNNQSWAGNELLGLVDCLNRETCSKPLTLSVSLIFELTGNEGTVRSLPGIPSGDDR